MTADKKFSAAVMIALAFFVLADAAAVLARFKVERELEDKDDRRAQVRQEALLHDDDDDLYGSDTVATFQRSLSGEDLTQEEGDQRSQDWTRRLEMLRSMPYLAFSESPADERQTGVVLYERDKAYQGYNFYGTRASGEAFLLDMNGQVVHRWAYAPKRIGGSDHAHMLENGDLLALKKHQQLLRLDWGSQLLWKIDLKAHHDISVENDGSIYTLIRETETYRGFTVSFDGICHLAENGQEIVSWRTSEALDDLVRGLNPAVFLDTVLDSILGASSKQPKGAGALRKALKDSRRGGLDYFHMNTVGVLPETPLGKEDPRFRRGNLLVCFRNVNQIAVLEKGTFRVLWAWGEGQLEWPHHPTMLPKGHILVFDNGVRRRYSRVVELDPVSEAIVWQYVADPPEDFFSLSRGSAQRLPNGNTLITDSNNGRVFEITPEGEIVWVWLNPVIQRGHRETVYRMLRFPSEQVEKLLDRRWWWLW